MNIDPDKWREKIEADTWEKGKPMYYKKGANIIEEWQDGTVVIIDDVDKAFAYKQTTRDFDSSNILGELRKLNQEIQVLRISDEGSLKHSLPGFDGAPFKVFFNMKVPDNTQVTNDMNFGQTITLKLVKEHAPGKYEYIASLIPSDASKMWVLKNNLVVGYRWYVRDSPKKYTTR